MAALYIKTEAGQQAFKARSAQLAGCVPHSCCLMASAVWKMCWPPRRGWE